LSARFTTIPITQLAATLIVTSTDETIAQSGESDNIAKLRRPVIITIVSIIVGISLSLFYL